MQRCIMILREAFNDEKKRKDIIYLISHILRGQQRPHNEPRKQRFCHITKLTYPVLPVHIRTRSYQYRANLRVIFPYSQIQWCGRTLYRNMRRTNGYEIDKNIKTTQTARNHRSRHVKKRTYICHPIDIRTRANKYIAHLRVAFPCSHMKGCVFKLI
jgi:hypothetical protein